MSIQTDYREQVDRFCEQADLLSGKDVLEMAKAYKETEHGAMKKRRGIKKIRTGLIVAAACVTATALTAVAAGAAGYGPLSTMFREQLQNSTTADLIDQGYLYEINQSFTDGIYRADLIGISGDRLTPQIIINFWIDDPEIAAANDTIELGVYTLGVKQYENELEKYGWMSGTAVRDSEIPNLYHASIRGYWVWMMTGEECVIDITAVNRVDKDGGNILDRTHMETRVTIPVESLRDVPTNYYRPEYDISLPLNGIVYHLNFAEYSAYHTTFSFYYQADHSDNDAFDEQLVMTVDGKEYRNLHSSASWCDRKGECGERGIWYVDQVFPGFDFDAAETVKLSIGTESVTLKDPSIPRYTEEDIDAMREEETVASDYYGIGELTPLSFNGAKYCVSAAQYYPSRTVVSMNYEADVIDDKAINEALILTVDGKDYSCIPFSCYTWRDTEGETGYKDLCFLNSEFPAIDYAAAQKITLTLGEQSVVLKDAQEAEEDPVANDFYDADELDSLSFNGGEYRIFCADYYPSRTVIFMNYEADVIDDNAINEALILTVDGTKYSCTPSSCCTLCDTEGEFGIKNRCYVSPNFPAVDYLAAQKITLTLGAQSVVLKNAQEAEAVEDSATEAQ